MTLADELDARLAETDEAEAEALSDVPSDVLGNVDRLLRKLRRFDREEAEFRAVADEQRARIDVWYADMTAGMNEERARVAELLEQFARAWKERTGHAPPRLVNGTLRLTPPRGSLVVTDEAAFRDWAEGADHLDLLDIKVSAKKDAIKTVAAVGKVASEDDEAQRALLFLPDGEAVPGVELVTPKKDSFTFSVSA